MEEISKWPGLKTWALAMSLVTGASAASVHAMELVAVFAEVVTKRWPALMLPPSSDPEIPA